MSVTLTRPDGLHLLARAKLRQLGRDEAIGVFADGLISRALAEIAVEALNTQTLAQTLHQSDPSSLQALIAALLVLDAEVEAVIDDARRVFGLPGFLTYRAHFPLDRFPLNTLRLPPLNIGGRYFLTRLAPTHYLAVRLDLHPELKVAGHVRIARSGPTRLTQRLQAIEHRLDRQTLEPAVIEAAITAGSAALTEPLTDLEQQGLRRVLYPLLDS